MTPAPEITNLQLVFAFGLILTAGLVSAAFGLGLIKSLVWGSVRTFVQLLVMGYALTYLFAWDRLEIVLAVVGLMCLIAVRTVRTRVTRPPSGFNWLALASLAASTYLIASLVTTVIIGPQPVYSARVAIPIAGMVLGNTLNAVSLAAERLYSEFRQRSEEVECRLSLGATPWEAGRPLVRAALKAGLTPAINSLMAAGLVFLPGMMVGQILGGADPQQAVRYQIVVMFMLTGAAAISGLVMVLLGFRRVFTADQALDEAVVRREGDPR